MAQRFKTGDISPYKAWYNWDGYPDGTRFPSPTAEERRIPLEKGETFPPVRSCNKGAYWVFSSMR
ncbi:MAG: YjzC family protein [Bacteroidales bacterium]|nr:YjzC family protein [Bacteroidales bacterium]